MTEKDKNREKKETEKRIEYHLRKYWTYISAIKNLAMELEYILPGITASYEYKEGSAGTFVITSKTEQAVLDRVESARAVHLNEQKKRMEIIVKSIETALDMLSKEETEFVKLRYFDNQSHVNIANQFSCSESYLFTIRKNVLDNLRISLMHLVE